MHLIKYNFLGYQVARVRAIFSFPKATIPQIFAEDRPPPKYMAYVEWYTETTSRQRNKSHGLYKIKSAYIGQERSVAIVPIDRIRRSVHLFPSFGKDVPSQWTSSNVLDLCDTFFVNSFSDRHAYHTML